jgi:hypothetical protein
MRGNLVGKSVLRANQNPGPEVPEVPEVPLVPDVPDRYENFNTH